jgi:GR25 family glycosyltransferase involved in LPS biosynthesis
MLVVQNETLVSSDQDVLLKDFLHAQTPFVFEDYKCENDQDLSFIKGFIRNRILIPKRQRIQDFQCVGQQDEYYVYERNMTQKIGFEFFWDGYLSYDERPLIYHLVSLITGGLYETNIGNCDMIYHSHFGNNFNNFLPNKKYIFFSGEKYSFPSHLYHLSISYKPDSSKTVCYPFFFTVLHTYQPRYDLVLRENKSKEIPQEFCAFIVSNPNCPVRNMFFQFLSQKYKPVKSYGRFMNNVGYVLDFPYNDERQLELLSKHKFVICFENTKLDENYVTEKILIAKAAGCVPIYWGSKKCLDMFHNNSFLYLEEESNEGLMKLLNKIILIDNVPELYLKIRNTPLVREEAQMQFIKSNLKSKMHHVLYPSHPYLVDCPKFFYINLERSTDRKQHMHQLFKTYGIHDYQRVEAIDGNTIQHTDPRLSRYEEATTMSHLKAIEEFYKSDLESAIICEDDISLEWIDLWKKSLNQIINNAPKDCEILQLAYTLYPHNFQHIKQDYNPFLLVTYNGAMAYYITRAAAEKILSGHTCDNPRLLEYQVVRPVSDVLVFDLAKTYTYKYCLFTHPDDNKSTIHDDHLIIHINSKICARKIYDIL